MCNKKGNSEMGEMVPRCPAAQQRSVLVPGALLSSQLLHLWSESPSIDAQGQARNIRTENPTKDLNKERHSISTSSIRKLPATKHIIKHILFKVKVSAYCCHDEI